MIQGSNTNLLIWKGNVDYRKIALDYATLGRAFRNFFSLQTFSCLFINTMIVKTINSWKPLSREFTYKVISTANIVHTYFSLLKISVHSQALAKIVDRFITKFPRMTDQARVNKLVSKLVSDDSSSDKIYVIHVHPPPSFQTQQ